MIEILIKDIEGKGWVEENPEGVALNNQKCIPGTCDTYNSVLVTFIITHLIETEEIY